MMKFRNVIVLLLLVLVLGIGIGWWKGEKGKASPQEREKSAASQTKTPGGESASERDSAREEGKGNSRESSDGSRQPLTALTPPVEKMAAPGPVAVARVTVSGKSYDLVPNQIGEFQRVYLEKGGSAEVTVRYPEGKPGDRVVATIVDGGTLNEAKMAEALELDQALSLRFTVQTTDEGGISRVLLTKGGDRKIIDLWGGPEAPLKSEVE